MLPHIDKWMFDKNRNICRWRNKKLNGRIILEPINIVISDSISGEPQESINYLVKSLYKSGIKIRFGHLSGYFGKIEENYYPQIPHEYFYGFSDLPWWRENNHGRFFGPHRYQNSYLFCGALSRESAVLHKYISFNKARDFFVNALIKEKCYELENYIELNNLVDDETSTTADHDGKAPLLVRK